jgi:hypothetical protein
VGASVVLLLGRREVKLVGSMEGLPEGSILGPEVGSEVGLEVGHITDQSPLGIQSEPEKPQRM